MKRFCQYLVDDLSSSIMRYCVNGLMRFSGSRTSNYKNPIKMVENIQTFLTGIHFD